MTEMTLPASGSSWVHHTSGGVYTVLFLANVDTKYPDKYPATVVYVGANGKLWTRPVSDWHRSFIPKDKARKETMV